MRVEIESAANFLSNILRIHSDSCLSPDQLEKFRQSVMEMLASHYHHHWFPENPFKGSGYRCLRINHKMDPVILRAGVSCGLDDSALKSLFPEELTLWIDPNEVSYRIGENGSICVLYDAEGSDDGHPQQQQQQQATVNGHHQVNGHHHQHQQQHHQSHFNGHSNGHSPMGHYFTNGHGHYPARTIPSPLPSSAGSLSSSQSTSSSSTSSLSSPSSSPPNWYNYNGGHAGGHSLSASPPTGLSMAKNLLLQFT